MIRSAKLCTCKGADRAPKSSKPNWSSVEIASKAVRCKQAEVLKKVHITPSTGPSLTLGEDC